MSGMSFGSDIASLHGISFTEQGITDGAANQSNEGRFSMPVPDFEWTSYDLSADTGASMAFADALNIVAADATVTVHLPDLTSWPQPRDKATVLLQTAAEVEHALLVQYLYAAFSLKSSGELSTSQLTAVSEWDGELRSIAKQEMGHLMTAQNLLLSLGLPPTLEREGFPSVKDLYPFKFQLEPLSQRSLAKYVTAEAPQDAIGIDDIVAMAAGDEGAQVNRVGTIYGLLGVVFSTRQEVAEGRSGSPSWDEHLRQLTAAAYQQSDPRSWHLDDGVIDTQSLKFQAIQDEWGLGSGDVIVYHIGDRAAAREAIRKVAEQGEGPSDDAEASHFDRFRTMYRGGGPKSLPPFPPAGAWNPARAVPRNPRQPPQTATNRTDRWAQLANKRYELLLGFIDQYLVTSATKDRILLAGWAKQEMFILNALRDTLVTLPQDGGVAAPPFTLPDPLELPATESERWQLEQSRTKAAIDMVHTMQAADALEAQNPTLNEQVRTDTARLQQLGGGTRSATTSFAGNVLPLFSAKDRDHMLNRVGLDLTSYDAVRVAAAGISNRIKGIGGRRMPPAPDPPLTDDQIKLFDTWVSEGCPP
jgi:rubrerythrin